MRNLLLIPLLSAGLLAGAHGATLKPTTVQYSVSRDGKAVGEATWSLSANNDGTWTLRSETKGSAGMAKLVGLNVTEESTFRLRDGKAQGLRYSYKQDAAIKHKERTIDFDWTAQRANVRDNGKNFSYEIPVGTIDRSTVAVAMGSALADSAHDATLPVAVKDHVEQQRFEARGQEKISVPAGKFDAILVERTDVPGKARSWYAPSVSVMPVRVEQIEGDGSKVVMELK